MLMKHAQGVGTAQAQRFLGLWIGEMRMVAPTTDDDIGTGAPSSAPARPSGAAP